METPKNHYPEPIETIYKFSIPKGQTPVRLDTFLTNSITNATRTKVQKAIEAGNVIHNGEPAKAGRKIRPLDEIVCTIYKAPPLELIPENIPLNVVYEDEELLVIDKPAGVCTHPGVGNRYGTVVNAALYHFGMREAIQIELDEDSDEEGEIDESLILASDEIRPGIVHRLDKDTSGLLVIAKNPIAHAKLAEQFAKRTSKRSYYAIVWGIVAEDIGSIEGNIGRSPRNRKMFAVVKRDGKYAKTEFEVIERYRFATLLKLKLHTGRTHQIRVHCSNINHPLIGDELYGGNVNRYSGYDSILKKSANNCLKLATRQMLHAKTLGFKHPISNTDLFFDSTLPDDMEKLILFLKEISDIL